ncbi:MAG: Maf family protein [Bdellovibrionota bacterium]
MHELLLVSQSPRRRELLTEAGYLFRVDSVKLSEIIDKNVNLEDAVSKLAREKAEAYLDQHKSLKGQNILVLSADTIVVVEQDVLGKPETKLQAREFLRRLSGRVHRVLTGIYLSDLSTGRDFRATETTTITFRTLTEEEIFNYIETGEPMDKAGAYGIQGLGRDFVSGIKGSWSNVVGLPLELLDRTLLENNWFVKRVTQ